jgi:hypothetical protein
MDPQAKQAYEGSTVHFFRSLVNKELAKEGFTTYQLIMLEKKRKDSISIKADAPKNNPGLQIVTKAIEDSMIRIYPDSVYRIMN